MASEGGRHEIDMAKMRLATARTQASAASKNMHSATKIMDDANAMKDDADTMMKSAKATMARATTNIETATKNMQHARSMDVAATNEVEAAEKCLAETEKRWEVIDVDQEPTDSTTNEGRSKKRRKITLSPPPNVGSTAATAAAGGGTAAGSGETVDEDAVAQGMRIVPNYLSREAKQALRGAMVSAMRHPNGEVDAACLQRAIALGSNEQTVTSAALVARTRALMNRAQSRLQQQRQQSSQSVLSASRPIAQHTPN